MLLKKQLKEGKQKINVILSNLVKNVNIYFKVHIKWEVKEFESFNFIPSSTYYSAWNIARAQKRG